MLPRYFRFIEYSRFFRAVNEKVSTETNKPSQSIPDGTYKALFPAGLCAACI